MQIPQYASKHCELVHNFIAFFSTTTKGNTMSKELNVIDTLVIEQSEAVATLDMIKLDDLSLALVGGGSGLVELG